MNFRWRAVVIAGTVLTIVVGLFIWQETSPPDQVRQPDTYDERRLAFAIDQLERICLSNLTASERTEAAAKFRSNLKNSAVQISSGKVVEIARGASQALPASLQVEERERVRQCLIDNLSAMMDALGKSVSGRDSAGSHVPLQLPTSIKKVEQEARPSQPKASTGGSAHKIAILTSLLSEGTDLADAPDETVDLNYRRWLEKASTTLEQKFDPGIAVGFERTSPQILNMTGSTERHRGVERAMIRSKNAFLENLIEDVRASRL
jgi:hypothetical protein